MTLLIYSLLVIGVLITIYVIVGYYRDKVIVLEAKVENYKEAAKAIKVEWIDHPNPDNPRSPHKLLQVITPDRRYKFTESQLKVAEDRAGRYVMPDES